MEEDMKSVCCLNVCDGENKSSTLREPDWFFILWKEDVLLQAEGNLRHVRWLLESC